MFDARNNRHAEPLVGISCRTHATPCWQPEFQQPICCVNLLQSSSRHASRAALWFKSQRDAQLDSISCQKFKVAFLVYYMCVVTSKQDPKGFVQDESLHGLASEIPAGDQRLPGNKKAPNTSSAAENKAPNMSSAARTQNDSKSTSPLLGVLIDRV